MLKPLTLTLALTSLALQTAPSSRPASRPTTGPTTRSPDPGGIRMPTASRPATRRRPNADEQTKYAPTINKLLTPISARVRPSVAVIVQGKHELYATVVRADGYLLTKASELKSPTFDVRLPSGVTLKGEIVSCAWDDDLALIHVPTANLTPIQWADPATLKLGEMVLAPGEKPEPIGWGVLSVLKRPLTNGMMGVMFAGLDDTTTIQSVSPGMPAARAGILPGDIVTHINEQEFKTRSELQEFLSTQTSGTEIAVTVRRGDQDLTFHLTLVSRAPTGGNPRSDMQNTGGNAANLSDRRSDFPSVLEDDIVLYPTQQGGPLVNLDGKAIGINIARGGRVETFATPAEVVQRLLPDLYAKKFPPTTHPSPTTQLAAGAPDSDQAAPPTERDSRRLMYEAMKKARDTTLKQIADAQRKLKDYDEKLAELAPSTRPTPPTTQP